VTGHALSAFSIYTNDTNNCDASPVGGVRTAITAATTLAAITTTNGFSPVAPFALKPSQLSSRTSSKATRVSSTALSAKNDEDEPVCKTISEARITAYTLTREGCLIAVQVITDAAVFTVYVGLVCLYSNHQVSCFAACKGVEFCGEKVDDFGMACIRR
jgi:hypothetical protein